MLKNLSRSACAIITAFTAFAVGAKSDGPQATLPSETPAKFTPRTEAFDYVKREAR